MVPAVIPCAVQREAVLCRHGILQHAGARKDPVSAQRHYAPQRARDDSREAISRMRYDTFASMVKAAGGPVFLADTYQSCKHCKYPMLCFIASISASNPG